MADTTGSGLKGELQDVPRVVDKSLPLRSRWPTVVHLQKLIDGKLVKMDKEPQNMQVIIADTKEGKVECLHGTAGRDWCF